jgi:hypothetical protein
MRSLLLILIASLLLGCGGRQHADYKPSETIARDALMAGLTAWSKGKPAGALPPKKQGQPTIQFSDFQWTAGKKLSSFKLLDETPTLQESTQIFKVHLELAGEKPQDVEYFVVGIDPLWVMRDKDHRSGNME